MKRIGKSLQLKKSAFLAAYAELGNVSQAANAAEVSRQSHYDWLESDEQYAKDFEHATGIACDKMEQEAKRRAIEGVDKPVYYKGEKVDTIKEYSDTLLIFLMKGNMPRKYGDRQELTGPNGGPLAHSIQVEFVRSNGAG